MTSREQATGDSERGDVRGGGGARKLKARLEMLQPEQVWPAASLRAQQSRFESFRYVFNNERPHEGLNNQVPASLYYPSSVRLSRKLPEFKYPKGLLLRRVNNSGCISWHKTRIFISEVFRFEESGFESVTPGFYRVFFRDMEIGELDAEELRFRAARRVVWACR
ncbi:MAG TPA: hypothetical protein VGG45_17330 [Terracidiphilus sp.]